MQRIGAESFGTNESYQAHQILLNYSHVLFHIKVVRSSNEVLTLPSLKDLHHAFIPINSPGVLS